MEKINLQQALNDNIVSFDLIDTLKTEFTDEEISIYIAIAYFGYSFKEVCDTYLCDSEEQIINCFYEICTFIVTEESLGFSSSNLGWISSTKFKY